MKQVVLFGSGLVAPPLIRYLLGLSDVRLIVAALNESDARRLVAGHSHARVMELDVNDAATVDKLVSEADAVVSLLPYVLNPLIAKPVVEHGKPLINSSYVSDDMRALDEAAKRNGALLLCEMGLDPGIDHMSAARMVQRVRDKGGKPVSFSSSCGGFPAIESNTNPWGYKFSWSPRGVVLAGRNSARYLRDGAVVDIAGGELFEQVWPFIVEQVPGKFELYANRNSLEYIDVYGLEGVKNMFRGTIRYAGWCETLRAVAKLGLLDTQSRLWPNGTRFVDVTMHRVPSKNGSAAQRLADFIGVEPDSELMGRLQWVGLLADRQVSVQEFSPLDFLAERLLSMMRYKASERDLVVMVHELESVYEDGRKERITSTLIEHGQAYGHSAMSRTVGLTAAIATRLVVQGKLDLTGVQRPIIREIYDPVLDELEAHGIAMKDTYTTLAPTPFDLDH